MSADTDKNSPIPPKDEKGKMELRGMFWFLFEILFLVFNLLFFAVLTQKTLWTHPLTQPSHQLGNAPMEASTKGIHLNVLCLGIDSVEGSHRTDTLLLIGIDLASTKVHMMSIPRDTRVVVEGVGRKINEIMPRYGLEMLRTLIEELLEVRINRFVKVDFQGFVKIIDALGGIDLVIEHAMKYDDNWANLHIRFDPGPVHLDGKKALEYVRFRADASADLGRIKRQQRFIGAVIEKITTPAMLLKVPEIAQEAFQYLQTDLTIQETLELAYNLKGKGLKIQSESLPGEAKYLDKAAFFIPYKDQAIGLGAKYFTRFTSLELDASFTTALASEPRP